MVKNMEWPSLPTMNNYAPMPINLKTAMGHQRMGKHINRLQTALGLFLLFHSAGSLGVERFTVLGLFKDKAVVEVNGKRRTLSPGQTIPEGLRLISADSQVAIIEIDGKQAAYALGSRIGGRFSEVSPQAVVRIWPDKMGMYTVDGSINGFPLTFIVDTGATTVAINRNEAKRLGLDYKQKGVIGRTSTASGVATAYGLTLQKIRIGEIELKDVKAVVIDSDFPKAALLGMSFLERLDMARDGKKMELRKK